MGLRLHKSMNSIPVTVDKGVFTYEVNGCIKRIIVPAIRTLSYETQCNNWSGDNIMVYVEDKEKHTAVVLRRDGTGNYYDTENGLVLWGFRFEYELPGVQEEGPGGAYQTRNGLMLVDIFTCHDLNAFFISSEIEGVLAVAKITPEVKKYLAAVQVESSAMGISVTFAENKVYATVQGTNITFDCKLYQSSNIYAL